MTLGRSSQSLTMAKKGVCLENNFGLDGALSRDFLDGRISIQSLSLFESALRCEIRFR
jgi:hypothetical protein